MNSLSNVQMQESQSSREMKGWAYCPICTHIVETPVAVTGQKVGRQARSEMSAL